MENLDIAIVGCGIGGLAASAFLARDGHRVRIFERFAEPMAIGAGLMLQPTGLACLASLGLDESAIALGHRIDRLHGETAGGRLILDLAYAELGPRAFGLAIHRGTLFSLLLEAAVAFGAEVHTAVNIEGTRAGADHRLLIADDGGEAGPFDLVIDASGMRSPLRAAAASVRLDRSNLYGAVWGVVPLPENWPHVHQLRQKYDAARVMLGILPIGSRRDHTQQLATVFWSLRARDYPGWRAEGIETWRSRALALWPEVAPLLDSIRSPDDMMLATYADIILDTPIAHRLAFIGDAARTASPQLGQGANLALVDALVLAAALRRHATVAVALEAYAAERRSHSRFYSIASRWLTPFFQSDSRTAAGLRDLAFGPMRHVPLVRGEMAKTLAGIKTGLFSTLDPADWHERYRL